MGRRIEGGNRSGVSAAAFGVARRAAVVVEGCVGAKGPKSKVQSPKSNSGIIKISRDHWRRASRRADFGGGGNGKSAGNGANSALAVYKCSGSAGAGSGFAEIASVMKVGQKPSAPPQVASAKISGEDGLPQKVFAVVFGAFLGLCLLKFGNPPIMEKWVT